MNNDNHVTDVDCKRRSGAILEAIEALNNRLYRDNGTISIQTRMDRHEQSLKLLTRLVYGVVALVLVAVAKVVIAGVVRGGVA